MGREEAEMVVCLRCGTDYACTALKATSGAPVGETGPGKQPTCVHIASTAVSDSSWLTLEARASTKASMLVYQICQPRLFLGR